MTNNAILRYFLATLVASSAFACDESAGGVGSVLVSLSGERAAQEGYPVGEGDDEIAFADGYSLHFDHVLLSLRDLSFAGAENAEANLDVDPIVVELVDGPQLSFTFTEVDAARYREVGFVIGPADADSRAVGEIAADDLAAMKEHGYALWVRGSATDGSDTYHFDLGFENTIVSTHCQNGLDETDGIVVGENASVEAEVTIHLDHLWFESYAYDGASLRFEPWAAVADAEGLITLNSLKDQALADLFDRNGQPLLNETGEPVVYDPGPLEVSPRNLQAYVIAAATTIGHFNGEGHCDYASP